MSIRLAPAFPDLASTLEDLARPRTVPLSPFGRLVVEWSRRIGESPWAVGKRAGLSTPMRITYALRARGDGWRKTALPYEVLCALADELAKNAAERSRLIALGLREHAPAHFADYVAWLEEQQGISDAAGLEGYRFPAAAAPSPRSRPRTPRRR